MAAPPLPPEDFVESDDFIVSDELEPLVEPLADGVDIVPLVEPLADGVEVEPLVEPLADGVEEPLLEPLADGVEVEPLVEPLADGAEVEPLLEPLADGEVSVFVSLPVAEGELPLLSPLVPPVPAAPLDEEPLELLPDPLGPCASAGTVANATATASANAPVNVFIALPPYCCGC